ncbi:MAG: glycosyltransferase family A protein [Geobacteraceae bacterium]|nr:glycosyltransferase family A protein [Geobacteraceae bacterium]
MTVAVLIPARDAAATLLETLDSVAAQSVAPTEVILVDDASTDTTSALAMAHPLPIRIIPGAGSGPAAATNLAAELASAEWLAPLDSDDLWPVDRLEVALATSSAHGVAAVIGLVETFVDPRVSPEALARLRYQDGRQPGYLPGALLIKRAVFAELGGFDASYLTGFFIDFWDRFRAAGHSWALCNELVLRRRIRPNSLSQREAGVASRLSQDFTRIARAAIQRRRGTNQ